MDIRCPVCNIGIYIDTGEMEQDCTEQIVCEHCEHLFDIVLIEVVKILESGVNYENIHDIC